MDDHPILFSSYTRPEEGLSRVLGIAMERNKDPQAALSIPLWIITPNLAAGQYIKGQLLKTNMVVLNVEFVTPVSLQKQLLEMGGAGQVLSGPEETLLLKVFLTERKPTPLIASVLKNPDLFLGMLTTVEGAGHSFLDTFKKHVELSQLAHDYKAWLHQFDLLNTGDAINFIRSNSHGKHNRHLCLYGFRASHWPLWPILTAAALSAEKCWVIQPAPRLVAEAVSMTWNASWQEISEDDESPVGIEGATTLFEKVVEGFEENKFVKDTREESESVEFLLSDTLTEEAHALVASALKILQNLESGQRIGIVLSNATALAREIGLELIKRNVLFRNEYGDPIEQESVKPAVVAWIRLQQEGLRAAHVLNFYSKAHGVLSKLYSESLPTVSTLEHYLDDQFGAVLSDLVPVMIAFRTREEKASALFLKWLNERWTKNWAWPAEAPLKEFLNLFLEQSQTFFGWEADGSKMFSLSDSTFFHETQRQIKRQDFCEMILEMLAGVDKTVSGDPFLPVVLTTPERADGQLWDYLILGGLNEGRWPAPTQMHPVLNDKALNTLNTRILKTSRFGEGTPVVDVRHGFLPTSATRNALKREQFLELFASARQKVILSASLFDETEQMNLVWSEYYERIHFCLHRRPLTSTRLLELKAKTKKQVSEYQQAVVPPARSPEDQAAIETTLTAYKARRDETRGFGKFQFALETPPTEPIVLSAKAWEGVAKNPAAAWLNQVLKVRVTELDFHILPKLSIMRGTLFHQLLNQTLKECGISADGFESGSKLGGANPNETMARYAQRLKLAFNTAEVPYPKRWTFELARVQWAIEHSLQLLKESFKLDEMKVVSEYELHKKGVPFVVECLGAKLACTGRADFLAFPVDSTSGSKPTLVIDFKTGSGKKVKIRESAVHLQLALYALAVSLNQTGPVEWLVVAPYGDPGETIDLDSNKAEIEPILLTLQAGQSLGIFGQLGPLYNKFAYTSTMPLATLPVSSDILQKKWDNTPELKGWRAKQ